MSKDYVDAEEVFDLYRKSQEAQTQDLNKTIVLLRTKIAYLEKELEERDKLPVPRIVENEIKKMMSEIEELKSDIKYYKKKVPVQVIINREKKKSPTRGGGQLR